MVNIKISAKFELQGSIMYSKEEVEQNKELLTPHTLVVGATEKGKYVKTTLHFNTRKTKPVYQVINISDLAYNEWLTRKPFFTCPGYGSYNKEQKIRVHLENIAENLGGKLVDFTIMPD